MATWRCMSGCGACCYLDPEERADVQDYLSPEEWHQYLGLVSQTGWCIHYDSQTRKCKIYENRPRFCRVSPELFTELYQVTAAEFNDFAIDCCRDFIADEYGEQSLESLKYEREILAA
ncbi:YkgJ family cysteine cluster protein [Synechococcus sp. PCC 6312]|uniref:YkgJ family cysteine cluster protein n=1 Tax=Synechococcus sp. (strain ATCC 27167 / PCC 6312) TaxID=195253 RepID=UPI00029EDF7C|nr:YkgJ family cysteine cluster protein [Synechococcus sp. PCC 6312]AFY59533.1 putative Fe-S oxidoreductase [Synechococcus sp. PCC 6312]